MWVKKKKVIFWTETHANRQSKKKNSIGKDVFEFDFKQLQLHTPIIEQQPTFDVDVRTHHAFSTKMIKKQKEWIIN